MIEVDLQKLLRVNARSQHRSLLFRNNSGCLPNPATGVPIRFGLGNDSPATNTIFKSSDLIGITSVECKCGHVHGVFTAIEVKKPGWKPNHGDSTYNAQRNFIETIQQNGGLAGFVSSEKELGDVFNR